MSKKFVTENFRCWNNWSWKFFFWKFSKIVTVLKTVRKMENICNKSYKILKIIVNNLYCIKFDRNYNVFVIFSLPVLAIVREIFTKYLKINLRSLWHINYCVQSLIKTIVFFIFFSLLVPVAAPAIILLNCLNNCEEKILRTSKNKHKIIVTD